MQPVPAAGSPSAADKAIAAAALCGAPACNLAAGCLDLHRTLEESLGTGPVRACMASAAADTAVVAIVFSGEPFAPFGPAAVAALLLAAP